MESDALIGRTIGAYEILEKIGQGGMAEVYKGQHTALRRLVAIKFLGRHIQTDANMTQRFQREAQAIAALRHPNIVQVFDFGTYESGHYLVMEYVKGHDLRQEMCARDAQNRTFSPEEIVNTLTQIGAALDYAHEEGVIHRDVKPGNILITEGGQAILGDFGLVMLRDRVSQATSGNTFGTPEYIAPEQAMDSRAAVPQSDIYALGGILYEMVTGRLPFEAETALSLALKHISEEPTPPRDYRPDLPQEVEAVILRTLAKSPKDRYPTALALVDDLYRAWNLGDAMPPPSLANKTSGLTPPPPATTPPPPTTSPPASPPAAETEEPEHKPRRRLKTILLALLLVVLGGLAAWQLGGENFPLVAMFTPTETPTPTLTPTPTTTPTLTPSPTATALAATGPTPEARATATATPTPTPEPTPTPTPTLAPGATITRPADSMVIHFVPSGSFLMGSIDEDAPEDERPQHELVLSPYWIDETEVTTEQYKQCVADGACEAPLTRVAYDNPNRNDHPITYISWEQAADYCHWAGQESGWGEGIVQLPTEAQWEKAASWDPATQTKLTYPWGNEANNDLFHQGNTTAPVGSYPEGASPYGVLDMVGNVWEWIGDWYDEDYYAQEEFPPDPSGPETGLYKIMRGGGYSARADTTIREFGYPESTSSRPAKGPNLGFRCVVNKERLPTTLEDSTP